jgi:iron complex transport system substrate-binding protein
VVLERDLVRRGFRVERQKELGFEFDGLQFEHAFVLDLLVDGMVVVEVKSVERLAPRIRKAAANLSPPHPLPCRSVDQLQ